MLSYIFERIPIRENYKEINEEYLILKAPSNIARICFLAEVIILVIAFVIMFYISYTTKILETKLSFQLLDNSYECIVLSPRRDSIIKNSKTSELIAFSNSRFNYDSCIDILNGFSSSTSSSNDDNYRLNVCHPKYRDEYLLTIQGITSDSNVCYDILLNNNYKFCYGSQTNYDYRLKSYLEITYSKQDPPKTIYNNNRFYFIASTGSIHSYSNDDDASTDITKDDIISSILVYNNDVYFIASNKGSSSSSSSSSCNLYKFSLSSSKAIKYGYDIGNLCMTMYGFSITDDKLYVLTLANTATIYSFDILGQQQQSSSSLSIPTEYQINDCLPPQQQQQPTNPSSTSSSSSNYLYYDSNNYHLYFICSNIIDIHNDYVFYRLNFYNTTSTSIIEKITNDQINSIEFISSQSSSSSSATTTIISKFSSVVVIDNKVYFLATPSTSSANSANLIQVNLDDSKIEIISNNSTDNNNGQTSRYMKLLSFEDTSSTITTTSPTDVISTLSSSLSSSLSSPLSLSSSSSSVSSSVINLGFFNGKNLIIVPYSYTTSTNNDDDNNNQQLIYVANGDHDYYNIINNKKGKYNDTSYFYALSIQLAYSYAICNSTIRHHLPVDPTAISSFYDLCYNING